MKLTKWFDGRKFVPAHVGPYKCKDGFFRYWNGEFWGFSGCDVIDSLKFPYLKSACQSLDWHGLAENPNGNQKV